MDGMTDDEKEALNALAEKLARSMTEVRGIDPDEMRNATGYSDSPVIKMWRLDYEWALRFIAAYSVMREITGK